MKRLISPLLAVLCGLCLLIAAQRPAMAYVDPGSGLLTLQSLASVTAAAVFFLRKRIKTLFGKKQAASDQLSARVKSSS